MNRLPIEVFITPQCFFRLLGALSESGGIDDDRVEAAVLPACFRKPRKSVFLDVFHSFAHVVQLGVLPGEPNRWFGRIERDGMFCAGRKHLQCPGSRVAEEVQHIAAGDD